MNTLFINAKILTMCTSEATLIEGAVGIVGQHIALVSDQVARIEAFKASHADARVVDCKGKLLMPGLINLHTHVPMSLQRNSGDDIELMQWLNELVWPFEARQDDDDIEAGTRLGIAEMLLGGTTTFVDMYWSEPRIAKVCEQMGIRALLGQSFFEPSMELSTKHLAELVEVTKGSTRIRPAVAPHAPYTCPPAVLESCVAMAKEYDLPLIIHLDEAPSEHGIIAERYDGLSPTEYIDKYGVLTPSTILAHCIHLLPSDIQILAERGSHVAYNPQCNMKIANGMASISEYQKAGINCGVGTDGVCSNNDLDMWDEMRTGAFLQKLATGNATTIPAYKMLEMVTVCGAKALGMEGKLGVISEGALADIIVVDTSRPHYRPMHNIASALVYCGKAADISTVMVDGIILVDNFKLLHEDIEAICSDVERRSARIFEQMK